VGYGDYSPQTMVGRLLISQAMLAGLIGMSMPLAIVGNTFSEAWESRTLDLIAERLKQVMRSPLRPLCLLSVDADLSVCFPCHAIRVTSVHPRRCSAWYTRSPTKTWCRSWRGPF
jgi:hypothetical protein